MARWDEATAGALEAVHVETRNIRAALARIGPRDQDPAATKCLEYVEDAAMELIEARRSLLSAVSRGLHLGKTAARAAMVLRDHSNSIPLEAGDRWKGLDSSDVVWRSEACTYVLQPLRTTEPAPGPGHPPEMRGSLVVISADTARSWLRHAAGMLTSVDNWTATAVRQFADTAVDLAGRLRSLLRQAPETDGVGHASTWR